MRTVLFTALCEHDSDNRGLTEDDLRTANYYYALVHMVENKDSGLPYSDVHHCGWIIGRRLTGAYVSEDFSEKTNFSGINRQFCFKDMYFDFEGAILYVTKGISLVVDPLFSKDEELDFHDCSYLFSEQIGKKAEWINYAYKPTENFSNYLEYKCIIGFENETVIKIQEEFQEDKYPQRPFMRISFDKNKRRNKRQKGNYKNRLQMADAIMKRRLSNAKGVTLINYVASIPTEEERESFALRAAEVILNTEHTKDILSNLGLELQNVSGCEDWDEEREADIK